MTYIIQVGMLPEADGYNYCEMLNEIIIEKEKVSLDEFENILSESGYSLDNSQRSTSEIVESLYNGKFWIGFDSDRENLFIFAHNSASYDDMEQAIQKYAKKLAKKLSRRRAI